MSDTALVSRFFEENAATFSRVGTTKHDYLQAFERASAPIRANMLAVAQQHVAPIARFAEADDQAIVAYLGRLFDQLEASRLSVLRRDEFIRIGREAAR